jgi:ATP-dependent RNA helicase RhlE
MFKEKVKNKNLVAALVAKGLDTATPLQAQCLSKINSGADLIAIAPEGFGKSTLITISAIQKLQQAFEDAPRALILVETMDKALAMKELFLELTKETDLRVQCAYEEGKIDEQNEAIYKGTDLVIGTAKRVLDIYFSKNLNLNKIKLFVIDDASMMIKRTWQGQIDRLGLSLPKCQHLIFTEVYDEKVEKLIHKFIVNPHIIEME